MARGSPILIIGGGIAGLALSAALKQIGLSADLIERTRHSEPVGAGIAVQPNAMRVLNRIGVGRAVRAEGAIIRRWMFRDPQGEVLCDVPLELLWGDADAFVGIERVKLHDALRSAA